MNSNQIKLNFYQVIALAFIINDLKKKNIEHDEAMINSFLDYVRNKFISLNLEVDFIPDIFIKLMKLYVIPSELYDYLKKITGIDVNDKYVMNDYYVLINSFDVHELPSLLLNNNKTNNLVKKKIKTEIKSIY